jgi:hypothetical protein
VLPGILKEEDMFKHLVFMLVVVAVSGCAQISNTYYVQGDSNRITATDSVNKSTDDLLRLNGSAYGDVQGGQEK